MEIRRALPSDTGQIAKIEEDTFSDPWTFESVSSLISTEGAMCYTAVDGSEVVAYILGRVIIPEGEIYRIATREDKRRRGIAFRLLSYAHKTERGHGLETLFLEVREKNTPARSLYESYGFKTVGMRKNYYKNPSDHAIIMLLANNADLIN